GPSVDATLPFFQYKVNAVSGGSSASPPAQCPLARRWSSYAKHRSNISCCSASVMASRLPFSKYPRQMYFIGLRLVVRADCTAAFATSFLYSRRAPYEIDSTGELFLRQFCELPREKPALRFVRRQGERSLVRRTGLRYPAESATAIPAGRVREVISGELLARQQVIDEAEALLRTFAHGNGHCAVELDDRRWLDPEQAVVEQRDLAPVRRCG